MSATKGIPDNRLDTVNNVVETRQHFPQQLQEDLIPHIQGRKKLMTTTPPLSSRQKKKKQYQVKGTKRKLPKNIDPNIRAKLRKQFG